MDSQPQEEAGEEPRNWLVSRRRRLIAAVIGLMMLALTLESPDVSVDDPAGAVSDVTVDDFDRIEALLATKENHRTDGRGPTVEVPADIAFMDERPVFDFDAFDEVMGTSEAPRLGRTKKSAIPSQPPSRDSFDDLNRINVLEIPEQMALGNGHQVIESPPVDSTSASSQNAIQLVDQEPIRRQHQKLDGSLDSAAVRILADDVTSSKVTRFGPATSSAPTTDSDHIRFTGLIFPVSRQPDQE
ncbi:MAG: hypothetical protein ABJZ55_21330 [Fuerstiella sp.]